MRFLLSNCILFLTCFSISSYVLASKELLPVVAFKSDRLLITSQPPQKEPRNGFITILEINQYYGKLLAALRQRNPEADARYFANKGQLYLLQTNSPMTRQQRVKYYPAELSDSAVFEAVNKVCPSGYGTRIVEGENIYDYINLPRLAKIQNKQEKAPAGEQLIPLRDTSYYPTQTIKTYQQVLAGYASRWNSIMYTECKKAGGAPDINNIPPVKVTHKMINNTLFILDETPFTDPRAATKSDLQKAIYTTRLAQAMRQKNVDTDVQNAIHQQQTYFLGVRYEAVGDWFGPGPRPKNLVLRSVSYGIEEGNIDTEEVKKLARVCPIRMIEGRDLLQSGQIGTIDFTNYPNAQHSQPHAAEMRQLFKNIRNYEKRWNQSMLAVCRGKLAGQKP